MKWSTEVVQAGGRCIAIGCGSRRPVASPPTVFYELINVLKTQILASLIKAK